jgi:type II secretory pathway component PulF
MNTYEYVAWDSAGQCKQGVKSADSEEQILMLLREERLTPVSVNVINGKAKGKQGPFGDAGSSPRICRRFAGSLER